MEGMPVATLAARKKNFVQELNSYIAQKKALTEQANNLAELTHTNKKGQVLKEKGGGLLILRRTWSNVSSKLSGMGIIG